MRRTRRSTTAAAALLVGISVATAACSTPQSGTGGSDAKTTGAINIGLLNPYTGPLAAAAKDLDDGWNYYWKQRGNHTVAGHEVAWHTADDALDPAKGITAAKSLVSDNHIDMLVGPITTAVGAAVGEEMARQKVPVMFPVLTDDNVTQRKPIEGATRIAGVSGSQVTAPLGQWAYQTGYRNVVTVCFDLDFGYEQCGGFVNSFTDEGGHIVKQLWHALGEQNYAPIVSQVKNLHPDAVFVGNSGSDSVRFLQAWSDQGLKIPLITGEAMVDQSNLRSMTDSAVGIISVGHYAEGLDAPATQEFVKGFSAEYGHMPSYFAASMYTAADWIVHAIEDAGGNVADRDAFVKAVRAVKLTSSPLGGSMQLDQYNNTSMDIYIRKVAKNPDGKLWNTVVKTYPAVSQFWHYDPQDYLKHPVYTKKYQGNGVWPDPQG